MLFARASIFYAVCFTISQFHLFCETDPFKLKKKKLRNRQICNDDYDKWQQYSNKNVNFFSLSTINFVLKTVSIAGSMNGIQKRNIYVCVCVACHAWAHLGAYIFEVEHCFVSLQRRFIFFLCCTTTLRTRSNTWNSQYSLLLSYYCSFVYLHYVRMLFLSRPDILSMS